MKDGLKKIFLFDDFVKISQTKDGEWKIKTPIGSAIAVSKEYVLKRAYCQTIYAERHLDRLRQKIVEIYRHDILGVE